MIIIVLACTIGAGALIELAARLHRVGNLVNDFCAQDDPGCRHLAARRPRRRAGDLPQREGGASPVDRVDIPA